MNKYHAKRPTVNGIKFDSKREAARYTELLLLERAGAIQDLRLQQKFVLIPSQKINGKTVERECSYYADFSYFQNGEFIVEDAKGVRTSEYVIKRKLMLYTHGIQIKEI